MGLVDFTRHLAKPNTMTVQLDLHMCKWLISTEGAFPNLELGLQWQEQPLICSESLSLCQEDLQMCPVPCGIHEPYVTTNI